MTTGLFIPCYINQFYPQVAIATLELLKKIDVSFVYPANQTCCGQPMGNAGLEKYACGTSQLFVDNFHDFDRIVAPSASCVYHLRHHMDPSIDPAVKSKIQSNIFELCDFIYNHLNIKRLDAVFPHKVSVHHGCHGLRGLRIGHPSEVPGTGISPDTELLRGVKNIDLLPTRRTDECCGFGGTFAIEEDIISVRMGEDKLKDVMDSGASVITSSDMSCLMHLDGIIRRKRYPVSVMHVAEILNYNGGKL